MILTNSSIIIRGLDGVSCESAHPYRLLPPALLPPVLQADAQGLTHRLRDGLACLAGGGGVGQLTGLVRLLEAALTARLRLTERLLDRITHYYVHDCSYPHQTSVQCP